MITIPRKLAINALCMTTISLIFTGRLACQSQPTEPRTRATISCEVVKSINIALEAYQKLERKEGRHPNLSNVDMNVSRDKQFAYIHFHPKILKGEKLKFGGIMANGREVLYIINLKNAKIFSRLFFM